ncbi:amino acid ABC transporter permease [Methylobacterium indicum]|uniref:Amino acid ABC transporter permease n=1 Tax=Methylobacterium indicum TaxID=1775910 RepID=A0ABR5GX08_9HYPH|nr:amino acid ABC transporter permease [Methylobacterium indicum]KMO15317.1 amino acid ABC transporter permease [Methylobacterium indicum]
MLDILRDYGLLLAVGQFPDGPIGGLALTLILAVTGLTVSFPLSVLIGVGRTSHHPAIAWTCTAFVTLVRALPLLMLIFWAYFVVPLIIGRTVSALTTVICALVVYETAYLAEVVRAAILALPKGQTEASRSLGLSASQTLRDVILPQALFNAIPSILNQFISLVKNTSVAYIISVSELTYSAYQINAQLMTKPLQVYLILAAIYFIICFSLSRLVRLVEKRIDASRKAPVAAGSAA